MLQILHLPQDLAQPVIFAEQLIMEVAAMINDETKRKLRELNLTGL
jgi:hypothetical protein